MKSIIKKDIISFLGIWYILLGFLAIFNSYLIQNSDQIYWFCYFSMFLLGIGMLKRDSTLILSQFNILAVGLVFWTIDFTYRATAGVPLWGLTDYFFVGGNLLPKFVSLQHLYTIPLVLWALGSLKINRKDIWKISFLQAIVIFIMTHLFTDPEQNINCVFKSCLSFFDLSLYYPWAWFVVTFLLIYITHAIVVRLPFVKK